MPLTAQSLNGKGEQSSLISSLTDLSFGERKDVAVYFSIVVVVSELVNLNFH